MSFEDWQARCVNNLLALDKLQLALCIIVDEDRNSQINFDKIKPPYFNHVWFEIYSRCFVRPSSIRLTDMNNVLVDVPLMHCRVIKNQPSLHLNDEDIQTIRAYDLDFILWFGSGGIQANMLNVARYGVWSFSHSDEGKYIAGLPCFWEIYANDDSIGARLQRLTCQHHSSVILKKGFLGVTNYSYARNIDEILFETACWPARVCIDILKGNHEYLNAPPSHTDPSVSRTPNILEMVLFIIKTLKNRGVHIYNILFRHDQWNIGIAYEPIHAFLKSKPKIYYLPAPKKGTFLADPFGILRDKKLTIVCEEFSYSSVKGVISSIEIVKNNSVRRPEPSLDLPVHLSYPYLIDYQGEIYCIPETSQAGEIGLFKAKEFPRSWIKVATLIEDFAGIDTTVFQYQGRWWLMCTNKEQNAFVNLFAWYAQNLYGPWKPHGTNPIKTDIRSARSAGTPFEYNGFLYRPAQDCSRTYGRRIVLNKVIRLTPENFEEEQAAMIEADADGCYRDGIHTISAVGDITLIDGRRLVFVGSAFNRALIRGLRKIFRFKDRSSNRCM